MYLFLTLRWHPQCESLFSEVTGCVGVQLWACWGAALGVLGCSFGCVGVQLWGYLGSCGFDQDEICIH